VKICVEVHRLRKEFVGIEHANECDWTVLWAQSTHAQFYKNLPIVSYNIFGDNVVCGFYYD